jgi:hypothetical protein
MSSFAEFDAARLAARLTVKALCRLVEIDEITWWRWHLGHPPRPWTIERIAKALRHASLPPSPERIATTIAQGEAWLRERRIGVAASRCFRLAVYAELQALKGNGQSGASKRVADALHVTRQQISRIARDVHEARDRSKGLRDLVDELIRKIQGGDFEG